MPKRFQPRLDVLPAAQRRLWHELTDIPRYFTLYGGTAIALRLAHRQSVDFDFFGRERFDPDALYRGQRFLRDAEVLQKTGDTSPAFFNVKVRSGSRSSRCPAFPRSQTRMLRRRRG